MNGIIYKIIGGIKAYELTFVSMSNKHAETVAQETCLRLGLIGRHYVELENGHSFTITN